MNLPENAWTLIVLPDTQYYSAEFPEVLLKQAAWIVANATKLKIRFVIHVGDIVHTNSHPEWRNARRAINLLRKARIPFALLPGNHDFGEFGGAENRLTFLNDYFSSADYSASECCGYFDAARIDNSWHTFSSNEPWMVLCLEFAPRNGVIDWANEIVDQNRDKRVIVATHAYLYSDGSRYDFARKGDTQNWSPKVYGLAREEGGANDAEEMWKKFIRRHRNISFVLSGHVLNSGVAYLESRGVHGNRVHQMLANYQTGCLPSRGTGGGGYLRLLLFQEDGRTVRVNTYSPWKDDILQDPANAFTVSL